jgi:Uma2 family endonuclease
MEDAGFVPEDREIDLDSDPPPDLVLEIDLTSDSRSKFPLYAALAVPEIWRYDGQTIQFFHLIEGDYAEMPRSRALPCLSRELLVELMEISQKQGQTAARKHLRAKVAVESRAFLIYFPKAFAFQSSQGRS